MHVVFSQIFFKCGEGESAQPSVSLSVKLQLSLVLVRLITDRKM